MKTATKLDRISTARLIVDALTTDYVDTGARSKELADKLGITYASIRETAAKLVSLGVIIAQGETREGERYATYFYYNNERGSDVAKANLTSSNERRKELERARRERDRERKKNEPPQTYATYLSPILDLLDKYGAEGLTTDNIADILQKPARYVRAAVKLLVEQEKITCQSTYRKATSDYRIRLRRVYYPLGSEVAQNREKVFSALLNYPLLSLSGVSKATGLDRDSVKLSLEALIDAERVDYKEEIVARRTDGAPIVERRYFAVA